MVRLRGTKVLHHDRQQPIGASAHVDRFDGDPHGVDTDHRSSSRIHAAPSAAAVPGQFTVIVVELWRSSMRISRGTDSADGNRNGTNVSGSLHAATTCDSAMPS